MIKSYHISRILSSALRAACVSEIVVRRSSAASGTGSKRARCKMSPKEKTTSPSRKKGWLMWFFALELNCYEKL